MRGTAPPRRLRLRLARFTIRAFYFKLKVFLGAEDIGIKKKKFKIDKINYILSAFCVQFFIKPIPRASVIYIEFNMQHLRNKLGTTYFSQPKDTVFMSLFSVQKATIGLMRSSSENDAFRSK